MEKIYRNGNIFPDEFYVKYTNFSSQKEFIKAAKALGIKISLTKTTQTISVKNSLMSVDNFIKSNTKFNTWNDFIENAQSFYKEVPRLLPKSYLNAKIAESGFVAIDNYEVYCTVCKSKITIKKGTIIPKCNCSRYSSYKILEIF
ncbi:MAG: hypothetical protein Q4A58_03965 [Fusobacterium sp.]|uniref:hypothetical protein n=1 Tax=Fusobacterium sp. TaxID=68766 RepID=UPI0026DB97CA|nr:hypothetical protein [Fusobacterium sp.]MDO4690434.1 hypothetical protein [Fusobacterium sp.]